MYPFKPPLPISHLIVKVKYPCNLFYIAKPWVDQKYWYSKTKLFEFIKIQKHIHSSVNNILVWNTRDALPIQDWDSVLLSMLHYSCMYHPQHMTCDTLANISAVPFHHDLFWEFCHFYIGMYNMVVLTTGKNELPAQVIFTDPCILWDCILPRWSYNKLVKTRKQTTKLF